MKRSVVILSCSLLAGCGVHTAEKAAEARYIYAADYMADPSVHVFDNTIYIYPTHDRVSEITSPEDGAHYDMVDYHVLRMSSPQQPQAEDRGEVLSVADVEWAVKQMWAYDVARKGDKYYMYFPAKDADGIFRIGVAAADAPDGRFTPLPGPMEGAYSIDPAVFCDGNDYYIYFGGLQGGQLQRWSGNRLLDHDCFAQDGEPALAPRVAKLADDMLSLDGPSHEVAIVDSEGKPLTADNPHRFFEAAWMHRREDTYYFSYSTGTSHLLCYATGDNPCGPFTFRGVLLTPVVGWTTHHSIVEIDGRWYLFFHDSAPSGGKSSLRSLKMTEIRYNSDGTIETVAGGKND